MNGAVRSCLRNGKRLRHTRRSFFPAHTENSPNTEYTDALHIALFTGHRTGRRRRVAVRRARPARGNPRHRAAARDEPAEDADVDLGIHFRAARVERHRRAASDLGIMVPNLVANPQGGGVGPPTFYIRGLPGVGIYIDGIWQSSYGFLESNFTEVERVEVLRGPQGTLFGRNTNGGAINITTRKPADEFGVRMNFEVGEFNRRNATFAVDVPLTDTLKTKFMLSSLQERRLLREPHGAALARRSRRSAVPLRHPVGADRQLQLAVHGERRGQAGTEPRIIRITNPANVRYIQYNVLAGNPDYVNIPGFTVVNWGFPSNAFTPRDSHAGLSRRRGRQVADEVGYARQRHHARSRVLHADGELGHHRQPVISSRSPRRGSSSAASRSTSTAPSSSSRPTRTAPATTTSRRNSTSPARTSTTA